MGTKSILSGEMMIFFGVPEPAIPGKRKKRLNLNRRGLINNTTPKHDPIFLIQFQCNIKF